MVNHKMSNFSPAPVESFISHQLYIRDTYMRHVLIASNVVYFTYTLLFTILCLGRITEFTSMLRGIWNDIGETSTYVTTTSRKGKTYTMNMLLYQSNMCLYLSLLYKNLVWLYGLTSRAFLRFHSCWSLLE